MAQKQLRLDAGFVRYAFERAPKVFAQYFEMWERIERAKFLGPAFSAAKASGKGFRGKLMNKKLSGRPGTWSPQVAGQFKSYMKNKGTLAVSVTMGIVKENRIGKALGMMETGGTTTSSKFMPVPVWDNLRKMGTLKNAYGKFKELSSAGKLYAIKERGRNDQIYYLSKGELLFIGKKKVSFKKQFNFMGSWQRRLPAVINRGHKTADRAARQVQAMINRGEMLG